MVKRDMRVLFTIVAILGLLLIGLASCEIGTVEECRFKDALLQPNFDAMERKYLALVSKHADVKFTDTSLAHLMEENAKRLDSLERDCRFVEWVGGALSIMGVVGIIIGRPGVSQKSSPNPS